MRSSILALLILLAGCIPLTEEKQFQREYEENDRKAQYRLWEEKCDGMVFTDNPISPCIGPKECTPSKWDWRYDDENERADSRNNTICISSGQLQGIF